MTTNVDRHDIYTGKSKTLYTAVLYDNIPQSSVSSLAGETRACTAYLKRLTREHLARANMGEVDPSVTGSPSFESQDRIAQLTEKVKRAYSDANGNPADGRWSFVSDLLRLNTTRGGRHWLGTNTDVKALDVPQHICVIPKTNEEWSELERKWKEEESVKNKVQKWIATAEFEPLTPETTIIRETGADGESSSQPPFGTAGKPSDHGSRKLTSQATLKAVSGQTGSLSKASGFGFAVIKRSNATVTDKPKPRRPPLPPSPPPPPSDAFGEHTEAPAPKENVASEPNAISCQEQAQPPNMTADVSDGIFLPPSFSLSQIETSTPLPGASGTQKQPAPIPPTDPLCQPTISSPQTRNVSFSPPPASQVPEPSSSQVQGDVFDSIQKRIRSRSPEEAPAAKRPRIAEAVEDHHPTPVPFDAPNDCHTTPLLKNLPRLAELLASTKRGRRTMVKGRPPSQAHEEPRTSSDAFEPDDRPGPSDDSEKSKIEIAAAPNSPNNSKVERDVDLNSQPNQVEVEAEVISPGDSEQPSFSVPELPSKEPLPKITDLHVPEGPATANCFISRPAQPEAPSPLESVSGTKLQTVVAEPSIEEVLAVPESRPHTPTSESPKSNPFRPPSAGQDSLPSNLEPTSYNLYGLDVLDNPSPTKSLSSLADSDSESDSGDKGERTVDSHTIPKNIHLLDLEFNPQFTSTQKPSTGLDVNPTSNTRTSTSLPSGGPNWENEKLPSTSQLQAEINSQVDEFDKFMEGDLSYGLIAQGL